MSPSETPRNSASAPHCVGTVPLAKKVRSAVSVSATNAPFSPVTIVTRSFIGESQFTRWFVTVPSSRFPTTATRSSNSRPLLNAVRAATDAEPGPGHPCRQVDVVGGEVLDHADVGDPRGERTLPAGHDLVDAAQLAPLEPAPQMLQRRVVPLDVPDGADQAAGGEGLGQPPGAFAVRRQRLLDERVHTGVGQRQRDLLVVGGRHGHHAVVEADRAGGPRRCGAAGGRPPPGADRRRGRRRPPARRRPGSAAPGRGAGPSCRGRAGRPAGRPSAVIRHRPGRGR